mmetsp:Transcript_86442/g.217647  ORF Transcript_86442/g.217647 Transcript_86442/m.217647 type:complete len:203 (+) Transcript_86442:140-748(+)
MQPQQAHCWVPGLRPPKHCPSCHRPVAMTPTAGPFHPRSTSWGLRQKTIRSQHGRPDPTSSIAGPPRHLQTLGVLQRRMRCCCPERPGSMHPTPLAAPQLWQRQRHLCRGRPTAKRSPATPPPSARANLELRCQSPSSASSGGAPRLCLSGRGGSRAKSQPCPRQRTSSLPLDAQCVQYGRSAARTRQCCGEGHSSEPGSPR